MNERISESTNVNYYIGAFNISYIYLDNQFM